MFIKQLSVCDEHSAAVLRVWQVLCQSNWCAPRIAMRRALRHTVRTWAVVRKNYWQFSNPRIDTGVTGLSTGPASCDSLV